jgi:hypothetical protein
MTSRNRLLKQRILTSVSDMRISHPHTGAGRILRLTSWLEGPLSSWWCALGWLGATAIFILFTRLLGGPSQADAGESVFTTWAIAHGHLSCAYPGGRVDGGLFIAPILYPMLAGGIAALAKIGHDVPFPTQAQLGNHCTHAITAMTQWAIQSNATVTTVRIGYVGWFVLLAGVIALLRVSGRGRCGWEPTAVVLVACAPPIFMCYENVFHPQDLVAMGLILAGLACARRSWWIWAGVLLGLAVTSQQFALLALAPLLVLAPGIQRFRYAAAAVASMAVIIVPMIVITSGGALRAALFGSSQITLGANTNSSTGGTVLWETHWHGAPLFVLVRILPMVLAMTLAWWAGHRFGSATLETVPLITIIATSLIFRLVFEENIFGYYFMAVAVLVILLDVVRGRVRGYTLAWLGLVTLVFNPVPWSHEALHQAIPVVIGAIGLLFVFFGVIRGQIRWYLVAWLALVVLTCEPLIWGLTIGHQVLPNSLWQVVLVSLAVWLAVGPLLSSTPGSPRSRPHPPKKQLEDGIDHSATQR